MRIRSLQMMAGPLVRAAASLVLAGACTAAAPAKMGEAEKAELAKITREMEGDYAKLETSFRAAPRDRFDPQAVIERVGRDPEKLAAWVRDNTDLLPYRGALRGPVGVLMDRGGNNLDRALLLAELLQGSGVPARLANATLPNASAETLAGQLRPRRADNSAAPSPEADAARQRVARQVELLSKALGTAATDDAAARQRIVAALADHWWVQRDAGGGKWIDVDLASTDGKPLAAAGRTVNVAPGTERLPLDAKDCHEVELRVVIEAFKEGKLKTATVLTHTLRPVETLGRRVSFSHTIGDGYATAKGGDRAAWQAGLKTALLKQETYMPALWVGDRPIGKKAFTTGGDVIEKLELDPAGKLGSATGAAMGGLFGGLSGGGDEPAKPTGVLTAEWLEYEVRVPGEPPQVVRRPVFDLVGPAGRAAGVKEAPKLTDADKLRRAFALVGQTQILLQPCDLPESFVVNRFVSAELADKHLWLRIGRESAGALPQQVDAALGRLVERDFVTPGFALYRRTASAAPAATFIDRPNIIHHRGWAEDGPDGKLVRRAGMDLALTSTAAAGNAAGTAAFGARLAQGVADTLAEHLALGEGAQATENTVGAFEAAVAGGAAPVVVRSAGELAKLAMPADALARATTDLAAGNVLVLASPAKDRWTWWRVDARTGQTVGVMDGGYNASLSEQEAQYEKQLFNFNKNYNLNLNKNQLLKSNYNDIMNLVKNKDLATNIDGLRLDWLGLITRRAMMASFMPV